MLISPHDHRQYRHITLKNALRILLISDPKATRSAAALSVQVGHFNDPIDREGLAHFLEHMLFLGTEKYPHVGEFQSFINRHGGSNNAWTGTENTTYFFDVQHDHFAEALDRFGQFFSAPLFNPESVDKERNVVDSEYKMKRQDDVRRIYQVQKETIYPAHPFAKFSVGNLTTLADRPNQSVHADLLQFYHTHYSANLMTAAIISPLSLDELARLAESCLIEIPNLNRPLPEIQVPFVTPAQQQKLIAIEPIKDIQKLTLSFSVPQSKTDYRTKPLSYIAHLLGYEGKGSLLSYLKSEGLINHLSAGTGISGSNFKEFNISVSLTEAGLQQTNRIISSIFQMIRLITEQGLAAWRYIEKQQIQHFAFRYQEPARPIDTVSHLVLNLQHFAEADTLFGHYMMEAFEPNSIQTMLGYLTPENVRIICIAKGQTYDRIAQWYDTPYRVTDISQKVMDEWNHAPIAEALMLPKPNPFISTQIEPLTIETPPHQLPQCLEQTEGFKLWFLQDTEYRVPKGVVYIAIDSPYAVASVENIVRTRVSVEMLLEALNESAYQAEMAGLSYNFYPNQGGVTLKLSGFNDQMPRLFALILDQFKQRDFNPTRFDVIKTQLLRNWKNAAKNNPINQLHNLLAGILQPNHPPYSQLITALESISLDTLPDFVLKVLSEIHISMFVYGNWHQEDARQLGKTLQDALRIDQQAFQTSTRPLVLLQGAGSMAFHQDCDHDDSAVLVYYQSPSTTADQIAIFTFANQLMSTTFYHELRTKQQLGYMVGTTTMPLNRHPGLIFYVQSPKVGPQTLLNAIDDYLNAFFMVLLELTEAQWQLSKQGLITKLQEPETHLNSRGQRLWLSITHQDHNFSQREAVIQAIQTMSRTDMMKFVVEVLKPRTADRLIMHSCGRAHLGQDLLTDTIKLDDIPYFRQSRLDDNAS